MNSKIYVALLLEKVEQKSPPKKRLLTPRQRQILILRARGWETKEIACLLNLSYQTIKNHMTTVLFVLNARNVCHAVILGLLHEEIDFFQISEDLPPDEMREHERSTDYA